ncbi:MAG: hypothetical protein A2255_04800 [Candidatus Melainabacteria bacterium RIFOXYA2_FULL_32_9]|nr:MAG: hypothetical protein A2255_04800 [Candidatus Melainabacteria bacterium RIFOXYA2_FULL_32_9]
MKEIFNCAFIYCTLCDQYIVICEDDIKSKGMIMCNCGNAVGHYGKVLKDPKSLVHNKNL